MPFATRKVHNETSTTTSSNYVEEVVLLSLSQLLDEQNLDIADELVGPWMVNYSNHAHIQHIAIKKCEALADEDNDRHMKRNEVCNYKCFDNLSRNIFQNLKCTEKVIYTPK